MIRGEGNMIIYRPIEAVWNFLTDLENYPKWHKGMAEARKTSEGPMGVGTTMWLVVLLSLSKAGHECSNLLRENLRAYSDCLSRSSAACSKGLR